MFGYLVKQARYGRNNILSLLALQIRLDSEMTVALRNEAVTIERSPCDASLRPQTKTTEIVIQIRTCRIGLVDHAL